MHNRIHICGWLALAGWVVLQSLAEETALLRGRIIDARTKEPTACTVSISATNGAIVTESAAFKNGFRSDGTFEKIVPSGLTRIRVTRGFETRGQTQTLTLQPGETQTVTFVLERTVDLRARSWYAGDSHSHMLHGERTVPVAFDAVALAMRAEDLSYFSIGHAWAMQDPTPEKLAAECARHSTPHSLLTWNMEAPKNYYKGDAQRTLGHCWTLGMRGRTDNGQDVITLLKRASAVDYQSENPTFANFESHALIHAQGGAVFYTHPLRWWMGEWGGQGGYPRQEKQRISNLAAELPLDTLLGPTYDGLDVFTAPGEQGANDKAFSLWALLLNHGYRVAATASSDSCFDRPDGATPGASRTYTQFSEPFSLSAVARATAAGHTFATTGPLLLASVDGLPPGNACSADGKDRLLRIEVWASGKDLSGLQRIEIFRNAKPFRTQSFNPPLSSWQTNMVLNETEAAWYCVRAIGGEEGGRAISGAFFFDPTPFHPPDPAACRVRVTILDAVSGHPLDALITEVLDVVRAPRDGIRQSVTNGQGVITIPGTVRLRADAPGYESLMLSPIFDYPPLVEAITRLTDLDLLDWATFERIRDLLDTVELTFRLQRRVACSKKDSIRP